MASAFNLTAQLNLRGPSNIGKIVSDIRKQLGTIQGNVDLKVNATSIKNISQLNSTLQSLNQNLKDVGSNATAAASAISAFTSAASSVNRATSTTASNTAKTTASLTKLSTASRNSAKAIVVARTELEEFGRQSALAVRRFAAFSAATGAIFGIGNAFRKALGAFVEFDQQFVKIQQVTDKTAAQLSGLAKEITTLSVGLGVASSDLINVAQTLAQAGLSARDTEKALRALALSDLAPSFDNINDTVEGSIALMRQFNISASDLETALGSVNSVAARFAVEASDLIAAIQRTGGVFATASRGVSEGTDALNEFLAIFTSVRQTTRESAETIATGLRTIFTRIQRGDTIEALREYGVNLTDVEGKFVGAYKAVQLLSEGLNTLDPRDIRFSRIIEELGGFRQIGKVIPLIQQFSVAQEALKVAQQGQGSLANDAIKAQLSLANQISKVREEFLAFVRDIGNSDTFQTLAKGALSLTSGLIKIASSLRGVLPILAILGISKGASALTQFGSGFIGGLKKVNPNGGGGSGSAPIAAAPGSRGGPSGALQTIDYAVFSQLEEAVLNNISAIESLSNNINNVVNSLSAVNNFSMELSSNTASVIANTASIDALTSVISSLNLGSGGSTFNSGGRVLGFARGGVVPGTGNRDTVPAMLQPGEFVIRKKAVETIGSGNLQKMNKYAKGGAVFKVSDLAEIYPSIENSIGYDEVANKKIKDQSKFVPIKPNKQQIKAFQSMQGPYGNRFEQILQTDYPIKQPISGAPRKSKWDYLDFPAERAEAKFMAKGDTYNDGEGKGNTELTIAAKNYLFENSLRSPNQPNYKVNELWPDITNLPPATVYYPSNPQDFFKKSIGGLIQKFASGGKALGARSQFKELTQEEILQLSTPDLIAYGRSLARDIFSTGGAGMAVGSEFIEVPQERIIPELESSLVSYMGKRGFWREKVAPFARSDRPAIAKKPEKLDRQSALALQTDRYSDEVAARAQQWSKIRSGSPIDNYLLSSLTDPILTDYRRVRSGESLDKQFHNTRLRKAVNEALESYDDFDYSAGNIDKLVSGMAAKRFAYGGLVQKFANGTEVESVGRLSEDILRRLSALGGPGPIKEAVGLDFINQTIRSKLSGKNKSVTAKQLLSPKSLKSIPDSASLLPAIRPILEAVERLGIEKENQRKAQLARNLQAAAGGAYRFGLASIFGPNGEFGYSDVSNAIEIEGKDGEKYLTQIIQKSLPKRYEAVIDKIRQSLMSVPQMAAEELQYVDIFGTGGPLALDFDDTLVKDADIPGKKFSDYTDLTKVEKALEGAKLTSLGQELQQRLKKYPQLLDSIRILTARPQNNAPLLAATLKRLELPIPESKITGVSGGPNKVNNLSDMETLIDDNLENIESVIGGGKKAIPYSEAKAVNLADASSRKSISTMEGYALEEMVRSLGVYVSDDSADPGRPIDFPKGLGIHASKWDLPPTIPTDTKRTNSSGALRRLEEEAQRFYIQNFKLGGEVSDNPYLTKYKQLIASILPSDMITPDGLLKTPTGIGEKIEIIPPAPPLPKRKKTFSEMLFGSKSSESELKGASYTGGFIYKILRKNLYSSIGTIPKKEFDILDKFINQNLLFHGDEDTIDLEQQKRSGSLAHETFHDIQGYLLDYYPDIFARLQQAVNSREEEIARWYSDPKTASWRTSRDYKLQNLFPTSYQDSPYRDDVLQKAMDYIEKDKELIRPSRGFWDQIYPETMKDLGRSETIPVLMAAAVEGEASAQQILSSIFGDAGLNRDFYKSLPKFALGGKVYDLQKGTGLNDGEFNELVRFGNTNDFTEQEFKSYLLTYLKQKQAKKNLMVNTSQLRDVLLSGTITSDPTSKQLALAEQLKGDPDSQYKPKRFALGGSAQDTVPALLTPGEFVINKDAAKKIGYAKLNKLNQADKLQGYNRGGAVGFIQKFAAGGLVPSLDSTTIIQALNSSAMAIGLTLNDLAETLKKESDYVKQQAVAQGKTRGQARAAAAEMIITSFNIGDKLQDVSGILISDFSKIGPKVLKTVERIVQSIDRGPKPPSASLPSGTIDSLEGSAGLSGIFRRNTEGFAAVISSLATTAGDIRTGQIRINELVSKRSELVKQGADTNSIDRITQAIQQQRQQLQQLVGSRVSRASSAGVASGMETDVGFSIVEYIQNFEKLNDQMKEVTVETKKAVDAEISALEEEKKAKAKAVLERMKQISGGTRADRFLLAKEAVETGDFGTGASSDSARQALETATQAREIATEAKLEAQSRAFGLEAEQILKYGGATSSQELINRATPSGTAPPLLDDSAARARKNAEVLAAEATEVFATRAKQAGATVAQFTADLKKQIVTRAQQLQAARIDRGEDFRATSFARSSDLRSSDSDIVKDAERAITRSLERSLDGFMSEEKIKGISDEYIARLKTMTSVDTATGVIDNFDALKKALSDSTTDAQVFDETVKEMSASMGIAEIEIRKLITLGPAALEAERSFKKSADAFAKIETIATLVGLKLSALGTAISDVIKITAGADSRGGAVASAGVESFGVTTAALITGFGQLGKAVFDAKAGLDKYGPMLGKTLGPMAGNLSSLISTKIVPALTSVPVLVGAAAAAVAIGAMAAAKAMHNAAKEFDKAQAAKRMEEAMDKVASAFEDFEKNLKRIDLLGVIQNQLVVAGKQAMENIRIDAEVPTAYWTNLFDALGAGGSEAAERSMILEQKGIGAYMQSSQFAQNPLGFILQGATLGFGDAILRAISGNNLGLGVGSDSTSATAADEQRAGFMRQFAPQMAQQQSIIFKPISEATLKLLDSQLRTGSSVVDVLANLKDASGAPTQLAENIARANPAIQEQILRIRASNDLSDEEKRVTEQNIIAQEAQYRAMLTLEARIKQMDLERLQDATDRFVTSLQRMYDNMDRAIAKTSFGLDQMTRSLDLNNSALRGQAKAGETNLKSINILQNQQVYSNRERRTAINQASGFFGSEADNMSKMLQIGPLMQNTVMSSINRILKENPSATDEKIAGNIRISLDKALDSLGLPSDLSTKMSKEVQRAFAELRQDGDEDIGFDELADKVPALSSSIQSARNAQEVAIRALEFYQKNVNDYAKAMNDAVDLQISANNYFRQASDIEIKGRMELAKTFGRSISLEAQRNNQLDSIRSLTGGATSPFDIKNNLTDLNRTRIAQQATSDAAAQSGPSGRNQLIVMQQNLKNTNVSLKENYQALKNLAESGDMASAALSKINEIQQKTQAGVGYIEKLVTSSPDEINKFNKSLAHLERNMRGLQNTSTAEDRSATLQTFNMLAPLLGDSAQQNTIKANILESMLLESGLGINATMKQFLDSLRNPEQNPEMVAAINFYDQSIKDQAAANRALGQIEEYVSQSTAEISAQKFSESLAATTLDFKSQQLADILTEVKGLRKDAAGRGGAPAAGLASGGLIYAASGQEIQFQPKGTDTVPAMLTPGEFVVNRAATAKHLPLLKNINNGYKNGGRVSYYQAGGLVIGNDWASTRKPKDDEKQRTTIDEVTSYNKFLRLSEDDKKDFIATPIKPPKLRDFKSVSEAPLAYYASSTNSGPLGKNDFYNPTIDNLDHIFATPGLGYETIQLGPPKGILIKDYTGLPNLVGLPPGITQDNIKKPSNLFKNSGSFIDPTWYATNLPSEEKFLPIKKDRVGALKTSYEAILSRINFILSSVGGIAKVEKIRETINNSRIDLRTSEATAKLRQQLRVYGGSSTTPIKIAGLSIFDDTAHSGIFTINPSNFDAGGPTGNPIFIDAPSIGGSLAGYGVDIAGMSATNNRMITSKLSNYIKSYPSSFNTETPLIDDGIRKLTEFYDKIQNSYKNLQSPTFVRSSEDIALKNYLDNVRKLYDNNIFKAQFNKDYPFNKKDRTDIEYPLTLYNIKPNRWQQIIEDANNKDIFKEDRKNIDYTGTDFIPISYGTAPPKKFPWTSKNISELDMRNLLDIEEAEFEKNKNSIIKKQDDVYSGFGRYAGVFNIPYTKVTGKMWDETQLGFMGDELSYVIVDTNLSKRKDLKDALQKNPFVDNNNRYNRLYFENIQELAASLESATPLIDLNKGEFTNVPKPPYNYDITGLSDVVSPIPENWKNLIGDDSYYPLILTDKTQKNKTSFIASEFQAKRMELLKNKEAELGKVRLADPRTTTLEDNEQFTVAKRVTLARLAREFAKKAYQDKDPILGIDFKRSGNKLPETRGEIATAGIEASQEAEIISREKGPKNPDYAKKFMWAKLFGSLYNGKDGEYFKRMGFDLSDDAFNKPVPKDWNPYKAGTKLKYYEKYNLATDDLFRNILLREYNFIRGGDAGASGKENWSTLGDDRKARFEKDLSDVQLGNIEDQDFAKREKVKLDQYRDVLDLVLRPPFGPKAAVFPNWKVRDTFFNVAQDFVSSAKDGKGNKLFTSEYSDALAGPTAVVDEFPQTLSKTLIDYFTTTNDFRKRPSDDITNDPNYGKAWRWADIFFARANVLRDYYKIADNIIAGGQQDANIAAIQAKLINLSDPVEFDVDSNIEDAYKLLTGNAYAFPQGEELRNLIVAKLNARATKLKDKPDFYQSKEQPQFAATGGMIYASSGAGPINWQPRGTDTVPAMLTPGEFVINRKATQENLPLLKAINSNSYNDSKIIYRQRGGSSGPDFPTGMSRNEKKNVRDIAEQDYRKSRTLSEWARSWGDSLLPLLYGTASKVIPGILGSIAGGVAFAATAPFLGPGAIGPAIGGGWAGNVAGQNINQAIWDILPQWLIQDIENRRKKNPGLYAAGEWIGFGTELGAGIKFGPVLEQGTRAFLARQLAKTGQKGNAIATTYAQLTDEEIALAASRAEKIYQDSIREGTEKSATVAFHGTPNSTFARMPGRGAGVNASSSEFIDPLIAAQRGAAGKAPARYGPGGDDLRRTQGGMLGFNMNLPRSVTDSIQYAMEGLEAIKKLPAMQQRYDTFKATLDKAGLIIGDMSTAVLDNEIVSMMQSVSREKPELFKRVVQELKDTGKDTLAAKLGDGLDKKWYEVLNEFRDSFATDAEFARTATRLGIKGTRASSLVIRGGTSIPPGHLEIPENSIAVLTNEVLDQVREIKLKDLIEFKASFRENVKQFDLLANTASTEGLQASAQYLSSRDPQDPQRRRNGGIIYANRGSLINFEPRGSDTVPAMLTPGEFVINRESSSRYRSVLEAINSGTYNRGGLVNYFNAGGIIPNYYQTGGVAYRNKGFDFTRFMQELTSSLLSAIPSSLQRGLQTLSRQQAGLGQQNTANGVSSIDSSTLDRLNEFTNRLKSIADTLAGLEAIPSQINVTGRHDVNIVINGDSALNQLKPDLQQLVMTEIKRGMKRLIEANQPLPSDKLIDPFTNNTGS